MRTAGAFGGSSTDGGARRVEFAEPDPLVHAIHRAIDELVAEGAITRTFAEDRVADHDRYNGLRARSVQV